jgi:hypothetical protein
MIKLFTDERIVMQNKIKWKNLPGKDKHFIYDTFIKEYDETFCTMLEYWMIDGAFVDYITHKAYYVDKNGNNYYIYHKNDFGRRIKTPYFKKYYKKRVDREGFSERGASYDKKPEVEFIRLSVDENGVLYQMKKHKYKRCYVSFENGNFKEIIFMKDGFRKNGIEPLDFKTKVSLGKTNKLYNKIRDLAITDYNNK